ncbi:MAG: hypothetical protein SFU56_01950 [Capsulimonadales bacterium]|nr:hypothetical protein [Capsulimonadales bacterium]
MRRRRNADAPDDGANGSANTPEDSLDNSPAGSEPDSQTDAPSVTNLAEASATDTTTPPAGKKPSGGRRRTEGRRPGINLLPGTAPTPEPENGETAAPAETPPPRRHRTAVRSARSAETAETAESPAEATPEAAPPTGDPVPEPTPEKPAKSRRTSKRTAKTTPDTLPAEAMPAEAMPAETLPAVATSAEATSAEVMPAEVTLESAAEAAIPDAGTPVAESETSAVPEPSVELPSVELPSVELPSVESSERATSPEEGTDLAPADEVLPVAAIEESAEGAAETTLPEAVLETPETANETPAIETPAESAPEVTAETEVTPAMEPTATGETSRSRRRNRTRTRKGEDSGATAARPTEAVPPSGEAAPLSGTASETPVPQRVRGQRRRLPVRSDPPAPPTTTSAPVAPAATPAPEAEGETPTRQRVRGLRRTVNRPAVTPVPSVPAVAAPEPLPPRYQPLPAETLARLPETKIVRRNNVPELEIGGEPQVPVLFFVNTEDAESPDVAVRQIRLAYDAGVRLFTILTHLPWKGRTGERRFDPLDSALQLIADNAPGAFILPRLIFSPTSAWIKQHDAEMIRYADGEVGDVSIASEAFWSGDAEEALRAAVEHIAQGPYAGNVFGFYLEHGEWFYEKGRGYDICDANRQGFRAWLRQRYRNNLVALRASWFDTAVTFDQAEIPDFPPPSGPTLFFSRREQRYRDYHEYASDVVAGVILNLGKAIKEASGNRSAVAVSYGYTLELPRSASGHLALGTLLRSPFVDILTGPLSYGDRLPGGSAPVPVLLDSIHLAGKLWVSEDDTKTHLSADDTPDTYNPRIESPESTWAVHSRNFGAALTRGAGISYMDLWGQGWLEDRELWQRIGRLRSVAESVAALRRDPARKPFPEPDVAVIVDERSFFDVRADESLLGDLVTGQRDALLRSGARLGFYLLSDLVKPEFPESVRLLLFLNAFRIPEAIRSVIRERFQKNGRTLAWVYGPGALEENLSELTDVLGIAIRLQPWGSKMGTQISSSARSPLIDALRGQRLGDEARINPSYYVADTKAQALGEYAANGMPSLTVRKHPRWQSVFIGERTLPLPLLRGLYRLAGVAAFTADDDVAWVGDSMICLHSAPGGGTTVYLPQESVLADLLTGETLAADGFGARLSMPPRGTRLLYFGSAEEVARFGIDPRNGPAGLTRAELPGLPQPMFEEAPSVPAYVGDDDALFRAALAGETFADPEDEADIETDDVEASPVTADAGDAGRKRRRRRRRRGKGDRDGELTDAPVGSGPGEAEEEDEEEEVPDAGQRVRPSLEELLPLSDLPADTDALPIPEEFLPLADNALTEVEMPEESARGRQRSRRSGARRGRRFGSADITVESNPVTLPDPDTGEIFVEDELANGEEGGSTVIPESPGPETETVEARSETPVAEDSVREEPEAATHSAMQTPEAMPDVETGETRAEPAEPAAPDAPGTETPNAGTESLSPLAAYDIFDDRE